MKQRENSTAAQGRPRMDAGGVPVSRTVALLHRWAYLERSCIRALAGWFLLSPAYEDKIALGHALWGHAERVDAIRQRLAEMRGGHHEANLPPALCRLGQALLHADGPDQFLTGYHTLTHALLASYRGYLAVADPAANAVEIRLTRQLTTDLAQTCQWLDQRYVANRSGGVSGADDDNRIEHLLVAAGGVDGQQPASPAAIEPFPAFVRPDTVHFDERIGRGTFDSYDQRMNLPFEQRRIRECEIYFNEFYAAGLLATILLDAWEAPAPWAFFHDLSHHFYDEVRHAEFGWVRLRELGVEPSAVNLTLMEHAVSMPFLHRLCYLTLGLEVYFMPRKRPRVKRYEEAGDARTQLFADVDWSDEGNHVQYGKRWVNYFLEDDARTVEELQAEIQRHMATINRTLPEGQLAPY